MPVKKRNSRRKADEVKAWSIYFEMGCDLLWYLEEIGLTEETAAPIAEATWHRIGDAVIEYIEEHHKDLTPTKRPYWAEQAFGPP